MLHQATSLAESPKTLEAHGSIPWVTNLLIVSHTLGILIANGTYSIILEYIHEFQVHAHAD